MALDDDRAAGRNTSWLALVALTLGALAVIAFLPIIASFHYLDPLLPDPR